MLHPIFESFFESTNRYERYDGINEVLIISNEFYEIKVTNTYIKLDEVQYNMNVVNPYYGIPISRETKVFIEYKTFLSGDKNEVFGITKEQVQIILDYYRSFE